MQRELIAALALVVSLMVLLSGATRSDAAIWFEDDFGDGIIDPRWFIDRSPSMSVVEQSGALDMSGTATSEYWITGGAAHVSGVSAPLTAESTFRVSGSGTGYAATLSVWDQWNVSAVHVGVNSDEPIGGFWLRTAIGGVITDYYLGPADAAYHNYKIAYDGSDATVYIDGVARKTFGITLTAPTITLHANARAIGDTVDARFDHFSLDANLPPFTPTFTYTFDEVAPDNPDILPSDDDCPVGAPCKFLWWMEIRDGQPLGGGPGMAGPSSIVAFADGAVVPDGAIVGKYVGSVRWGPVGRCATEGTIFAWEMIWLDATMDPGTTTGSPSDLSSFSNWPTQLNGVRDDFLTAHPGSVLSARAVGSLPLRDQPTVILNVLAFTQSDGSIAYIAVGGDPTGGLPLPTYDICSPRIDKVVSLGLSADNPDTPEDEGGIPLRTCIAAGTHTFTASFDRDDTPPGDALVLEDTATCSPNTPVGTGVPVSLNGGTEVLGGIDMTFSEVSAGGSTSVVTTTTGPPPPTGFKIVGLAELPLYFDINTDTSYSGDLTVCIRYDETQVAGPEANLRLMQRVDGFVDITTSIDTANNIICGTTTHLSIFVVAEPIATPTPTATATPLPLGGSGVFPDVPGTTGDSGGGYGVVAGVLAAAAGALALGGAAWYARRRLR